RSQVLAPKLRTGPSGSRPGETQTMCMSEWTSMPAASGWTTFRETGVSRGSGLGGVDFFLRAAMGAATVGESDATGPSGVGQEGDRGQKQSPQRDRRRESPHGASPMTGSRPLGP